ncbi:MAG: hypothetical protein J7555_11840 [Chloroflexi bacterium]|jgi:uncharacterized protein YukE|nr:hypothetical protein [Chloroflexota bacterium]
MSSAYETTHYAWQGLRSEWQEARQHWNDVTADHFLAYYWNPLEAETERFQQALYQLNAVLEAARNVAWYG